MSAFALKTIAVITMLIDHIGAFILLRVGELASSQIYFAMRSIGRIAFPIFAYLIANGCKHTKNIDKYLLRLGIFAIASEAIFDIAQMNSINFLWRTNIFYTLFLGVLGIAIYERAKRKKWQWLMLLPLACVPVVLIFDVPVLYDQGNIIATGVLLIYAVAAFCIARFAPERNDEEEEIGLKRKIIPILAVLPLLYLADFLSTDYASWGVGFIILLYLANPEKKLTRAIAMTVALLYFYGSWDWVHTVSWSEIEGAYIMERVLNTLGATFLLFSLIPVLLILFYNGKQGANSQAIKWGFYAFYPVHIAVLVAIRYLLT